MLILDATASARSIWYQKENPYTIFMDMRQGTFSTKTDNTSKQSVRLWKVYPDILAKWQYLPFKNNSFDMIVFDPPHIFRNEHTKISTMMIKYGNLNQSWREEIRIGAAELFRALKPNGLFILKWSETDISINEILKLISYPPMFGTRTGQANNTHWITFIKHTQNKSVLDYENV